MIGRGGWSALRPVKNGDADTTVLADDNYRVRTETQPSYDFMLVYVTHEERRLVTVFAFRDGALLGSAIGRTQAQALGVLEQQQFLKDDPISFERGVTGWVPKGGA